MNETDILTLDRMFHLMQICRYAHKHTFTYTTSVGDHKLEALHVLYIGVCMYVCMYFERHERINMVHTSVLMANS